MKLLLNRKDIKVNIQNKKGITPIGIAAQRGSLGCFKQLLNDSRIDVTVTDNDGKNLLYYIDNGRNVERKDVLKGLLFEKQNGVNPNNKVFSDSEWQQLASLKSNETND